MACLLYCTSATGLKSNVDGMNTASAFEILSHPVFGSHYYGCLRRNHARPRIWGKLFHSELETNIMCSYSRQWKFSYYRRSDSFLHPYAVLCQIYNNSSFKYCRNNYDIGSVGLLEWVS